jgi:hypothetical protein
MELYLRWLEAYDVQAGEETPLGLILCAEKSEEHVKLLRLHEDSIRVARYLTALPPRDILETKLHQAIQAARQRLQKQRNTPKSQPTLPHAGTKTGGKREASGETTAARRERKKH